MAIDALVLVLRADLALAAGVLVALALRAPVRRWFGARVAYALWLIPPLAALASFAPPRRVEAPIEALPSTPALADVETAAPAFALDLALLAPLIVCVWAVGAAAWFAGLCLAQRRFERALGRLTRRADLGASAYASERAEAGPAVVGVFRPRIVTPADFDQRFDAAERDVVLAHERAHLAQGDPVVNALAALITCLNWFNPLIHWGVRALRVDQELACDAAVIAERGGARRRYAEAMLKSHGAPIDAPLVCAWPSNAFQPLKERLIMLKQALPSRARRLIGASVVGLAAIGACAAVFAARPTEVAAASEDRRAEVAPHFEAGLLGEPESADGFEAAYAQLAELEAGRAESEDAFEAQMHEFEARMRAIEAEALAEAATLSPEERRAHPFMQEQMAQMRQAQRQLQRQSIQIEAARAQLEMQMAHAREAQEQMRLQAGELERARAEMERALAEELPRAERELAAAHAELDRHVARLQAERDRLHAREAARPPGAPVPQNPPEPPEPPGPPEPVR